MLRNEQQLAGARKKLRALHEALNFETDADGRRSLGYLIADVEHEIAEYEGARDGVVRTFAIRSLDDLGPALVKARIASGKMQHELAAELDISPQQVSKDESREYETAGVAKLADVLDILDYELVGEVRPKSVMVAVDSPINQAAAPSPAVATTGARVPMGVGLGAVVTVKSSGGASRLVDAVEMTRSRSLNAGFWGALGLQYPLRVERVVPHAYSATTDVFRVSDQEVTSAH